VEKRLFAENLRLAIYEVAHEFPLCDGHILPLFAASRKFLDRVVGKFHAKRADGRTSRPPAG
jgi:hypothetical protein